MDAQEKELRAKCAKLEYEASPTFSIAEAENELRFHLKDASQTTVKKLIQLMETGVIEWGGWEHCAPRVCGHSERDHSNEVCPIGVFEERDDPMPAVGISIRCVTDPWDDGFLDPKWVAGIARQYLKTK